MAVKVKPKNIDSAMTTDTELSVEAQTRANADNGLQSQISTVSTNVSNLGTNLQSQITNNSNKIATETTNRINGDANLQAQISAISVPITSYKAIDQSGTTTWTVVDNIVFVGTPSTVPSPKNVSFYVGGESTTETCQIRLVNSSTGYVFATSGTFSGAIGWLTFQLPANSLPTTPTILEVQVKKTSGAKKVYYRATALY